MAVPAAVFKAECLKLMDQVAKTGKPVIITRHGRPIAQLAPIPAEPKSLFGYMRNTVRVKGDIIAASVESWSALSGDEDQLFAKAPVRKLARHK